jgi:predicted small lipoprotein YifL
MRTFALITVLLVATAALAGCGSKGGPNGADDAALNGAEFENLQKQQGNLQKGKGLIRGIVLDEALAPIAGAKVELVGLGTSQTATEAGAFLFNNLDPGTYFVSASKAGYAPAQQSSEVKADVAEPSLIKIRLQRVPGAEPRAETLQFEGFISCGFKVLNIVFDRNYCDPLELNEDKSVVWFPTTGVPTYYQSETIWKSTQQLGTGLVTIQWACAEGGSCSANGDARTCNVRGESPLVCFGRVGVEGEGGGQPLEATGLGTDDKGLYVQMYSHCAACINAVQGVGVVVNQQFQTFTTFFYNFEPEEGWLYVNDGDPAPPQ